MLELDKFIKMIRGSAKEKVTIDLHELTKSFSPESMAVKGSKKMSKSTESIDSKVATARPGPTSTSGTSGGGSFGGGGPL